MKIDVTRMVGELSPPGGISSTALRPAFTAGPARSTPRLWTGGEVPGVIARRAALSELGRPQRAEPSAPRAPNRAASSRVRALAALFSLRSWTGWGRA